jgi:hypothetical protein
VTPASSQVRTGLGCRQRLRQARKAIGTFRCPHKGVHPKDASPGLVGRTAGPYPRLPARRPCSPPRGAPSPPPGAAAWSPRPPSWLLMSPAGVHGGRLPVHYAQRPASRGYDDSAPSPRGSEAVPVRGRRSEAAGPRPPVRGRRSEAVRRFQAEPLPRAGHRRLGSRHGDDRYRRARGPRRPCRR